jgi:hypothetical protein
LASTQSRSPFRILETLPDSENELNVYALSWEILRAFDLGCSSLRANIDPCELTDILVRRGYAIVDETAALGAHGRPEYIAKTLGLTEDRQTRILSKSRISKATYLKIRQQFERSIDDFLSRSESNRQMVEKARADFQSKVKLLGGYYSWDRRQLPIYVKRRRLSRALFEPMLIAFTGMRSDTGSASSLFRYTGAGWPA